MASTIGPARRALWALIWESADLSVAQKVVGRPDRAEGLGVALLGLSDPTEAFATLGPQAPMEEAYGIELLVWKYDPECPEERGIEVDEVAFATADAVRDIVTANRTLTQTVYLARVASQRSDGVRLPTSDDTNKAPSGRLCLIEMTVACRARA